MCEHHMCVHGGGGGLGQVPMQNVGFIAKRGESGLFTFEIFKRSHTHTHSLPRPLYLSLSHTHSLSIYNLAICDL